MVCAFLLVVLDAWRETGKKNGVRWGRDAISTNFDGSRGARGLLSVIATWCFYAPTPALLASDTVRGASAACRKYNR
jgi:hypothetical protein